MRNKNKILVVAAHPDDEVLGCGATVARLAQEGNEVFTLILGEGVTSRDNERNAKKCAKQLSLLKNQAKKANQVLGVSDVFTFDFPDNRFDTVDFIDIVKAIEKIKNKLKPDIIFTHYANDLNIDHQIVYKALLTATRPMSGETVKQVYSFEILSSTEWAYPLQFSPDVFFDVKDTMDKKLKAMEQYVDELRLSGHPRSLEGIELAAKNWGIKVGLDYAEAFKTVRVIQ